MDTVALKEILTANPEIVSRLKDELQALAVSALRQSHLSFRKYSRQMPDMEVAGPLLQESHDFAALATALNEITGSYT